MFSIIILTYNEETAIAKCLDAIRWCDDIIIIDSFSSDTTIEIAKKNGARVFQRKFDNYSNQRNAAIESIPEEFDWILMIDADERIPLNLQKEIREEITRNSSVSM